MGAERLMFVRYLGTKVCFTLMDGSERFYLAAPEDVTPEEKALCDNGGGYLPVTVGIDAAAE